MKLAVMFLGLCVALVSHSAAASIISSMLKPVAQPVASIPAAAEAVVNPLLRPFNPLKFMLASMGIPVDHLIEGSKKCVAELGPEAMVALKALLGALTFFG
ncbi:PREDICTED: secretoglobin family 3A member 1 [Chrysochloris asiatica]|uniref:Secretoglobin family 3A member 1 n=1 Tax=Chrysochloris asiatica TaxID=185453 RepID=A0A9B0X301_CHRAS|nr:PREDICTED: secretoglobin family 3A member 1 [Chrysochloris asiatica]